MQILLIEALILLLLIAITIAIIFDQDLLACAVIYCAFSFCTMFLYIIMGAPDVAFTEAVIGVVSTIYFVIAIRTTDRRCRL
ncbi:MAG: Na(+)/H(+) antiporter subunit B [Emergencia sp.]